MKEIKEYNSSLFENIKRFDENGVEFWFARELSRLLQYTQFNKFENVIEKAKLACSNSENIIDDHFTQVGEMVPLGSGSYREFSSYKLSRYACYLIVQNADSRKRVVAQGQTYFAIQTRKQEIIETDLAKISEEEKRLAIRDNVKNSNKELFNTAKKSGVSNFGKFNNAGYQGLYDGETASTIKQRKGITKKDDILDHMGSTELAANWFRITQTDEKLKNDSCSNEEDACNVHKRVGKTVRKTMIDLSGTKPEELPTPDKSIKQLESEKRRELRLTNQAKKVE